MLGGGHISTATLTPTKRTGMGDLVPGGYLFTHFVFWTVVALVAIGTNAVAIILSVGLALMLLEAVRGS